MTPRQAIFYGEYIKDGNGTRAAIAAGFPEKSAHVAAARMLKNKQIAAAIEAWKSRQCARLEITAERVLQEVAKLALYDPGMLYDSAGERIPVHKLDDRTRAAVGSVEDETREELGEEDAEGVRHLVTTRRQKVKMADKGANLERLCKHLGLFGDGSAFSATLTPGPAGLPADSKIEIVLRRPE